MALQITLTFTDDFAAHLESEATRNSVTVEELLGGLIRKKFTPKAGPRARSAERFLRDCAAERREWSSSELFKMAQEEGLSRNAIFEAKNRLNILVRPKSANGSKSWVWEFLDTTISPLS